MNYNKRWALLYIVCILFNDIVAVHYWKLSDNGKQIEAVQDSAYSVIYPGSLLDFLNQYDYVKMFGKTSEELRKTLKEIGNREKVDEPDIEHRLRQDDPHCKATNGAHADKDTFSMTYSSEICVNYHSHHKIFVDKIGKMEVVEENELPTCAKWHAVDNFNNFFDETLVMPALTNSDLSIDDPKYGEVLKHYMFYHSFSNGESDRFSKLLTFLLKNSDKAISAHPYVHMAAAAYWRSKGNYLNAFQCYKTTAHIVNKNPGQPEILRDTLIFSVATLLHKLSLSKLSMPILEHLHKSGEAEVKNPCFQSILHAATGDTVASLGNDFVKSILIGNSEEQNYDAALQEYKKSVEIQMNVDREELPINWWELMDKVEYKISLLSCLMAIASNLEFQKDNLEKLVKDKNHYNEIYGNHLKIEQQVANRMLPSDVRLLYKYSYELIKYGYNPHRECFSTIAKRFVLSSNPNDITGVLVCMSKDTAAYENYFQTKRRESQKNRPVMNDSNWRVAELFARDRNFERKLKQLKDNPPEKQNLQVKYPYKSDVLSSVTNRFWRRADWPNSVDCQAIVSRSDLFDPTIFPQISLSFENRGILLSDLLTKHIGLDFHDEHPLPWEEPFCDDVGNINQHPMSTFKGVVEMLDIPISKPEYAESKLKTVFVRLADKIMEDIEVAQRIRTLLQNNIGPRWIALNLAGLYWRVKGNPRQTALCLISAVIEEPYMSDFALTQLAQALFVATGRRDEAIHMLDMADGVDKVQPLIPWLQGRLHLLRSEVDDAVRRFKEALDRDPFNDKIAEDLLKVACSGKWSKPAISSQFPTVCCSSFVQNAVCFRDILNVEQCFVVDPDSQTLVYHRCNGVYTGLSYKPPPYVNIISPFLPIFRTLSKNDLPPFEDEAGGIQTVETKELPLDYGGPAAFFLKPPPFWWTRTKNEIRYEINRDAELDSWELELESDLALIPPKPLSFLWVREKREMLKWDVRLPVVLPVPFAHQIRKGLSRFPPPRKTLNMCNGVNKLSVLLENQVSTWVSVTAKGEDIEKYVDLRGPVPGIAGLQPVCPSIGVANSSPILGLDHIPAFALSDQFLFYKPEKMLTDALKSLGNDRDSIEHVAARLHTAMLTEGMGSSGNVNWLLCVLSSLYWRVVGDAPRAVGCLRCALQTAPSNMRDVVLISLANICHQAGFLNSALIAAGAALSASPNLVAIHFTIANIYASIGDYQKALDFYYSTLSLQGNFEPAKERIRAIYCHSGESFAFQVF